MTSLVENGPYEVERNGRTFRLYGCARRGCDAVNPDYLAFGAHGKSWCLGHRPLLARLRVWWQERSA
jgi:hypothetical protein